MGYAIKSAADHPEYAINFPARGGGVRLSLKWVRLPPDISRRAGVVSSPWVWEAVPATGAAIARLATPKHQLDKRFRSRIEGSLRTRIKTVKPLPSLYTQPWPTLGVPREISNRYVNPPRRRNRYLPTECTRLPISRS